ncbi:glutamyl-tRNA(Gln) amidotransferase subunit A [Spirochaetota bacterium]|nr:glutamyl-tRNA(Gln) amidotransferase subunit A [Spirochaetota bacterium]
MSKELTQLTLTEAVSALKAGTINPLELIDAHIKRIETDKATSAKPINATLHIDKEAVRTQLKRFDQTELKNSLLAGVPIAIKRNINLTGFPVDCSSKILQGYKSAYTATAVANYLGHGGTIFANLNMDEFAMGSANKYSIYGQVHNPLNRAYIPGGSSGGPAAAVSANEALATLGSDTGGSIRQPAACCGVVGLKPTYGRVSRYGVVAFASSFDQVGPITKSVADNALLLQAIAGHDERDSTSSNIPVPNYSATLENSLKGITIGIPREYYKTAEVIPEILAAVTRVQNFYKEAGAIIKEISLPATEYGLPVYYVLAPAEASTNLARFDGIRYGRRSDKAKTLHDLFFQTRSEGLGAEVKRRMFTGGYVLSAGYYDAYYLKALKVRRRIYNEYHEALRTCDVLLVPTMPYRVPKIDEPYENPVQMYLSDVFTIAANLTGAPAISVPCGKDEVGLPISFQLMGRPFDEATLYNIAHVYEKNHPINF